MINRNKKERNILKYFVSNVFYFYFAINEQELL